MKGKVAAGFIAVMMFATVVGLATAQDTTKATHKKTRTLTGCLQKGDDANEYNLTTKVVPPGRSKVTASNSTTTSGIPFAVTGGSLSSQSTCDEGRRKSRDERARMDKDAKEHGHMTVTA